MWPENKQYTELKGGDTSPPWQHRDWIDMQDTLEIKKDWLVPLLRNITDKLTKLRNAISDNNHDDIGYMEDNKANADWEMVNDWLNNTYNTEIYPSKQTLIKANKLWKEYNN